MTSNILVNPIANAANPDEELVLALAAHLEPVLENWRMGVDLRDEVQELEALLPSLNSQAETLDQEIQAIVQKIQAASKDYKSPPLLMLISGVVIG